MFLEIEGHFIIFIRCGILEVYHTDAVSDDIEYLDRHLGIRLETPVLDTRVRSRVAGMLDAGWLEEVRGLTERGFGAWLTASQAIGYAELAEHLDGRLALDEAMERTVKRTKELARRQMAWFRRDPRVQWFDAGEEGALEVVDDVAAYLGST